MTVWWQRQAACCESAGISPEAMASAARPPSLPRASRFYPFTPDEDSMAKKAKKAVKKVKKAKKAAKKK